jgi:lysozyme
MQSLMDAASLVPFKEPDVTEGQAMASMKSMSLDDLLDIMVVPNAANRPTVEWTFEALGSYHSAKLSNAEKDDIVKAMMESTDIIEEVKKQERKDFFVNLGKTLIKAIIKRTIKKVLKTVIKRIIRYVAEAVLDVIEDVVRFAVRGVIEWLIRPLFMGVLEFIGVNPELWPFIAIAGGVAALAWYVYDKFFKGSGSASDVNVPQDKLGGVKDSDLVVTPQEATAADEAHGYIAKPQTTTAKPPESHTTIAEQARPLITPAAAPIAAGDAVATGSDADVKKMIMRHEGVKTKPYKDSRGLWTVGVGHLIGDGHSLPPEWDRELSMPEVMALFDKDFESHKKAAATVPNYDKLNPQGQAAMIDLAYNMGGAWWHRWPQFTKFMQDFNIEGAVNSLQTSAWYTQVGARAREVVGLLATNENPTTNQQSNTKVTPGTTVSNSAGTPQQQAQAQGGAGGLLPQPSGSKTVLAGKKGELLAVNS